MDVYNLPLHEVNSVEGTSWEVMRVPGGWIYTLNSRSVFVPKVDYAPRVATNKESPGWRELLEGARRIDRE